MYGETIRENLSQANNEGLSPHVRGNLPRDEVNGAYWRSIPACTGKPRNSPPEYYPAQVYPRMYGETSGSK